MAAARSMILPFDKANIAKTSQKTGELFKLGG
jgi:hypothetical protein